MITISSEDYKFLCLCKNTLYDHYRVIGLCPKCKQAILLDGYCCEHCGYDPTKEENEV